MSSFRIAIIQSTTMVNLCTLSGAILTHLSAVSGTSVVVAFCVMLMVQLVEQLPDAGISDHASDQRVSIIALALLMCLLCIHVCLVLTSKYFHNISDIILLNVLFSAYHY